MSCGIQDVPCSRPLSESIIVNEIPLGLRNCINTSYITRYAFSVGTLEVYIDGIKLSQDGFVEHINSQGFTILIDPTDSKKLAKPLSNIERLEVNYLRAQSLTCIQTI